MYIKLRKYGGSLPFLSIVPGCKQDPGMCSHTYATMGIPTYWLYKELSAIRISDASSQSLHQKAIYPATISNKQKLEEDESRKCFIQVLGGLEFLHSHGIIHKDVRPETILLVDREFTAKLEVTVRATFLNAPGPYLAIELLDIMSSPIVTVLLADGDSLEAKASHTSPRNFMSNGILRIKAHPWIYGRLR